MAWHEPIRMHANSRRTTRIDSNVNKRCKHAVAELLNISPADNYWDLTVSVKSLKETADVPHWCLQVRPFCLVPKTPSVEGRSHSNLRSPQLCWQHHQHSLTSLGYGFWIPLWKFICQADCHHHCSTLAHGIWGVLLESYGFP